jgi:hypothetical protein
MSFMRYIFLILFGIHLLSSVALASDLNSFDTQINKNIQLTEIDSAEIYQNLIAEENFDANYIPNISGMIVGGTLFGLGTFSIGAGYYLLYEYSNSKDWGNEFAAKMEGTICLLGGDCYLLSERLFWHIIFINITFVKIMPTNAMNT